MSLMNLVFDGFESSLKVPPKLGLEKKKLLELAQICSTTTRICLKKEAIEKINNNNPQKGALALMKPKKNNIYLKKNTLLYKSKKNNCRIPPDFCSHRPSQAAPKAPSPSFASRRPRPSLERAQRQRRSSPGAVVRKQQTLFGEKNTDCKRRLIEACKMFVQNLQAFWFQTND